MPPEPKMPCALPAGTWNPRSAIGLAIGYVADEWLS